MHQLEDYIHSMQTKARGRNRQALEDIERYKRRNYEDFKRERKIVEEEAKRQRRILDHGNPDPQHKVKEKLVLKLYRHWYKEKGLDFPTDAELEKLQNETKPEDVFKAENVKENAIEAERLLGSGKNREKGNVQQPERLDFRTPQLRVPDYLRFPNIPDYYRMQ
mmetsp:Transcript_11357/g.27953  ORF Transcript_11357/g.27953 Transcript_11357/m.27953 type:complete len:164 (+) Transcript_11357:224-715(+)